MSNVVVTYNYLLGDDVDPASVAELKRAVKWLRASDTFSMEKWVSEMSPHEARELAQDILQAAGKIGERLKDRHKTWEERLLGQRLRAAESFEDLEYEDLLSVLATREAWLHVRNEHHAATIRWMIPRVQKEVEAHWQAVAGQQAEHAVSQAATVEKNLVIPEEDADVAAE